MSPRDTRTGGILESIMVPALQNNGYHVDPQVVIGTRPGGRTHKVDIVASLGEDKILVSLKWQQVGGTAEQKVPFEVICLSKALSELGEPFQKAYLVLGGEGWTLRNWYLSGELFYHLPGAKNVRIMSFEGFVALVNQKGL